ncbi:MAG: hypothetical protein LBR17_04110 [Bacteroidales bacterium]|jgi:hypothetical protein|nr:hypothetical protein [Bacteroidales bacterium]
MKKLILSVLAIGLSAGAFAQSNVSTSQTYFARAGIWGGENSITILVNTYDNPNQPFDNYANIAYVLQTSTDYSGLSILLDSEVKVVKYMNILLIKGANKDYLFYLSDIDISAFSTANDMELYEGFGLAEIAVEHKNLQMTASDAETINTKYVMVE